MTKFKVTVLVFVIFALPAKGEAVSPPGVWFKSDGKVKAVALMAQGLNFKAEKMNALAQVLTADGIDVFRSSLTGLHGDDMSDLVNVSAGQWREDFRAGYSEASRRAQDLKVPIYFVGFSLGGLVALNEMTRDDSRVKFDRMALFAPAISLRPMTSLLNVLKIFGKSFCLPSKNLPDYRVHPCTPMGAYEALLTGITEFREQKSGIENVPTILFIDPSDELVSLQNLKGLIRARQLNQWSINEVNDSETSLPKRIHHLIIDEPAVGPKQWKVITSLLISHFSNFGGVSAPAQ